jgi:subtilisin-like proprotein convertase family protein
MKTRRHRRWAGFHWWLGMVLLTFLGRPAGAGEPLSGGVVGRERNPRLEGLGDGASLFHQQEVAVGEVIPDGNAVGLVSGLDVTTPITSISRVTVTLEIEGGFNGDLYAYLSHGAGFAVLLNRVGRTELDPTGHLDIGFSITLDDDAVAGDVHRYREALDWEPLPGPLTGTWQPDGRTTDPAEVLDTDPRTAMLASFAGLDPNGHWTLFVADADGGGEATLVRWGIRITGAPSHPVVGRYLAYKHSVWDANRAALNPADAAAIAPDKSALRPGGRAGFANYSTFSQGLNCVMLDLAGGAGTLTLADFQFRSGNTADPAGWPAAPAPVEMAVWPGAGVAGSTRIAFRWADQAIRRQWLQVTVRATAATGLAEPDVFYFGNAVGETGNSTVDARVSAADALRVLGNVTANAAITNPFDHNRDGRVGAADRLIVLGNISALQSLVLLNLGGGAVSAAARGPGVAVAQGWEMGPAESRLRVRWTAAAASTPVRIWTSEVASPGDSWEIYETLGVLPGSSEPGGLFLPIDSEEPVRFYRLEALSDEESGSFDRDETPAGSAP